MKTRGEIIREKRHEMNRIKQILKQKSQDLKDEIQKNMVKVDGEYRNVPEMLVGERAGIEYALLVIDQVERGGDG
jgi:CO dehydrogenase nickel-insertion accessory protein CooC1